MASELENKIIEVLTIWGEDLVNDAKQIIDASIKADGGGQTSSLSGSVNYKVLNQGGKITFQLTMNDYWKFQDKGVDGTKVSQGSEYKFKKKYINLGAALKFVKARHLKFELSVNTKAQLKGLKNKTVKKGIKQLAVESKQKSMMFAIARSVAEKGIKPLKFMDKIITQERMNKLKQMLAPVIKQQFILEIKKELQ